MTAQVAWKVFVSRRGAADLDALRKKASALAGSPSEWWWTILQDEIVFCFRNGNVAVCFKAYCVTQAIQARQEWPQDSTLT